VASAFSGIFSSSFSSCLDLERVMPAGAAGGGNSRCRAQNCAQPSQYLLPTLKLVQSSASSPRQGLLSYLSLHLQPGLGNTSNEWLCDMWVALSTLGMVMPQQGAQGASRDVAGE
jgi:hypothetical protein